MTIIKAELDCSYYFNFDDKSKNVLSPREKAPGTQRGER